MEVLFGGRFSMGVLCGGRVAEVVGVDISNGVGLEGLEGVAILGCELGLAYGVLVARLLSTLCIILNFQR